jgi:DNA-binding transcriptional MerR regulator
MENIVNSEQAAELLGISKNNLRQLVYRKLLAPVGKEKRRSLFNTEDVLKVKAARKPLVPSV